MHAHHRAESRIDSLDLARDQAVAHIVHTAAAIRLWNRGAQQSDRAHFFENARVGVLTAEGFEDARRQLTVRIVASRVANHFFLLRQLRIQQQRIIPMKLLA
jgi:hypothetical protein